MGSGRVKCGKSLSELGKVRGCSTNAKILDLQCFHMLMFNPWIPVANTKVVIVFVFYEYIEVSKCLKLFRYFWFYSASKRQVLVSVHAQSFFIWAKKNFAVKCKLLIPKNSYRVTKSANEKYLPYLKLCGRASM